MKATLFEPFAGPITLDNLDDLLAHHAARFGGWTMKEDDEEEVDDPGDDDADDENDDDDDDENDDDDDDPDEGKTPEQIKAELRQTREALAKANAEAKKRRLAAKGKKPAKRAAASDDGDDDDDGDDKVEAKWKKRVINVSAKGALAEAGALKPERLLRLVDVDDLDVDDEGEVDGLDDEVDRLKEEYPELFAKKGAGGGRRRVETGDRGGSTKKKMSATERQAAAILGKK